MTRVFGCVCNQPERVATALQPVRDALVAPGPVSRWGLAYVQSGHVLLSRTPKRQEQVDFGEVIDRIQSDYIVGWTTGDEDLRGSVNTQPYRFRSWFYAQSQPGSVLDRAALLSNIPPYLRRNIRGAADGELLFHLFLSLLHDAGNMDDPYLDADIVRIGLRDALRLASSLTSTEADSAIGNIVVSNGRVMVVVRLGEQPVFVRHLFNEEPRTLESERYRAVLLLACDDKPGDGFEAIPVGSAVLVHRRVEAEIKQLSS